MFANNGFFYTNANDRTEQTLAAYYPNKVILMVEVRFTLVLLLQTLGFYRIISQNPESGGEGKPYIKKLEHQMSIVYLIKRECLFD